MRRRVFTLSGLVLVSVAGVGCAFKGASREDAALEGVLEAWTRSFNDHDAKALSKLYSEDADAVFGHEDILHGRTAVEKHWADFFSKNPQVKTEQVAVRRRHLTPTVVVEDGMWEESGHTDKEALARPNKDLWVAILVKNNGKWLITCDRGFSPIPKPTE